jgi:hypothetical protein
VANTLIGLTNLRVCLVYSAPGKVEPMIAGKRVATSSPGTIGLEVPCL